MTDQPLPISPARPEVKLQVLIVTYGEQGLRDVAAMNVPAVDGVEYIVSCQSEPQAVPPQLERNDVKVHFTPTRGIGLNRNNTLQLATAPYVLLADDDLIIHADSLRQLIELFDQNPSLDFAALMCRYPYPRTYPPAGHDLREPWKNYTVVSYEIAMRLASVRQAGLSFCDMGVGSPRFLAGEEEVLRINAIRLGLNCRFYPILVCDHPDDTTGRRDARRPGVLQADGVLIALNYRYSIIPRLALKAWRVGGNVLKNFYNLSKGALYALRHPSHFLL